MPLSSEVNGPLGETSWLAQLCMQAYDGEPGSDDGWHGPSLRKILSDVSWEEASRRLTPEGHNIWEFVLHIAVWDEICVQRLFGAEIPMTTGSAGDWPELPAATPAAWAATKQRLTDAQAAFTTRVAALRSEDLDKTVVGWPWSYRLMIHGTLHHDLYHGGQIALLKRALRNTKRI